MDHKESENEYNRGKLARLVRDAVGLRSFRQFARDAGLSPTHISVLCRGVYKSRPTVETLQKIASASDSVPLSELLEAAGYPSDAFYSDPLYDEFVSFEPGPFAPYESSEIPDESINHVSGNPEADHHVRILKAYYQSLSGLLSRTMFQTMLQAVSNTPSMKASLTGLQNDDALKALTDRYPGCAESAAFHFQIQNDQIRDWYVLSQEIIPISLSMIPEKDNSPVATPAVKETEETDYVYLAKINIILNSLDPRCNKFSILTNSEFFSDMLSSRHFHVPILASVILMDASKNELRCEKYLSTDSPLCAQPSPDYTFSHLLSD